MWLIICWRRGQQSLTMLGSPCHYQSKMFLEHIQQIVICSFFYCDLNSFIKKNKNKDKSSGLSGGTWLLWFSAGSRFIQPARPPLTHQHSCCCCCCCWKTVFPALGCSNWAIITHLVPKLQQLLTLNLWTLISISGGGGSIQMLWNSTSVKVSPAKSTWNVKIHIMQNVSFVLNIWSHRDPKR